MAERIAIRRKRTYGDAIYGISSTTSPKDGDLYFQFDATLSEDHGEDAEVTEHPVEKGAAISDNIRQKMPTLKLVGVVTNTPFDADNAKNSRDLMAWNDLVEVKNKGELVTVATLTRVYTDMAITSIRMNRTPDKGQAAHIEIGFKAVKIVNEKFAIGLFTTKKVAKKQENTAAKTDDKGTQETTANPVINNEETKTTLKRIVDSIKNFISGGGNGS